MIRHDADEVCALLACGQRWLLTVYCFFCFFVFDHHFYFPVQLERGFTLSDLLDKPWSQVSSLSPPGTCLHFYRACGSPRWTSGSPRMLLVLVSEFESRRGEILTIFAEKKRRKKKDQLLRAPSVGKHNSTRVDEGRKSSNIIAIKMQGTNRSGEGGRRACYVTPDLSYV